MPYVTLNIGNHHCIELRELTNAVTEVVDTGATVEVTLKDVYGAEVDGQAWPASMPHADAGLYRATLDSDLELIPEASYTAVIDAVGSGGEVGHWEVPIKAVVRTS